MENDEVFPGLPGFIWVCAFKPMDGEESMNGLSKLAEVYPTRDQARQGLKENKLLFPDLEALTPLKYNLCRQPCRREWAESDGQFLVFDDLPNNMWLCFDMNNGLFFEHIMEKTKRYFGYAKWFFNKRDGECFEECMANQAEANYTQPYLYTRDFR